MKLTSLFKDFFRSERAGGILLIFCTLTSLLLANSPLQEAYLKLWDIQLNGNSISTWINDGLMAIFFLLIGLELEREIYSGELSKLRNALLPLVAATGGMIVPAVVYLLINAGTPGAAGAGIPMATDIAFAIGVLSLAGSRVPNDLKVLLTALAVIDDLGAIVVIAVFYTSTLSWMHLFIALFIFAALLLLKRLKVNSLIPYLAGGILMWFFMHQSGVHATITGVLIAFAIPFGDGKENSPSYRLQHFLHRPVAFIILPLFALANTCLVISPGAYSHLYESASSIGILTGLIMGKPIGIFLFSFVGTALGVCSLPKELGWRHVMGAGFLGGIGFTMSIFITLLAFDDAQLINDSKIAILVASSVSAILGFSWLKWMVRPRLADLPS